MQPNEHSVFPLNRSAPVVAGEVVPVSPLIISPRRRSVSRLSARPVALPLSRLHVGLLPRGVSTIWPMSRHAARTAAVVTPQPSSTSVIAI